jgi:hypothetical protein
MSSPDAGSYRPALGQILAGMKFIRALYARGKQMKCSTSSLLFTLGLKNLGERKGLPLQNPKYARIVLYFLTEKA